MKEDTLNRANDIAEGIKWADNVIYHINHKDRLSFDFDITRDCIENHTTMNCPGWLIEIIAEAVENKKQEWIVEFNEL